MSNQAPKILALATSPATPVEAERTQDGQPVRRFRKELLRVGEYTHPGTGQKFSVSREGIGRMAETFRRYTAAGNKAPLPIGHENWEDPERNRGWAIDAFAEGDSLVGIVELVGDGIKLAGTSDVSIYAEPSFTDSKGNSYEWVIRHVALCTDPVILGLDGFVPLAASQNSQPVQVPVLKLSGGSPMPDPTTPNPSPAGADPAEAVVQAICDKVITLVKDKAKTAQEKKAAFGDMMKQLEKALGVFDSMSQPEPKPAADAPPAEPVAASQSVSPVMLQLAGENRQMKIDRLVSAGKITPAVAADLKAGWTQGQALSLSLSESGCKQFDALVAALDKNEPVLSFKEKTGPQSRAVALAQSAQVSDEEKKLRADMLADTKRMAGIK
jgi:hypothetical protein